MSHNDDSITHYHGLNHYGMQEFIALRKDHPLLEKGLQQVDSDTIEKIKDYVMKLV